MAAFLMSEICTATLKAWAAASIRSQSWNQLFWKKYTTAERITQKMGETKFFCQNKYSTLHIIDGSHSNA